MNIEVEMDEWDDENDRVRCSGLLQKHVNALRHTAALLRTLSNPRTSEDQDDWLRQLALGFDAEAHRLSPLPSGKKKRTVRRAS